MNGFELGVLVGLVWTALVVVTVTLFAGARRTDPAPLDPNPVRGAETPNAGRSRQTVFAYGEWMTEAEYDRLREFLPNAPKPD